MSAIIDIKELSKRSGYKINTIYKKINLLELGIDYFKPNKGKLFFDERVVDFLKKGEHKNGESIPKKGQPIHLGDFFAQEQAV